MKLQVLAAAVCGLLVSLAAAAQPAGSPRIGFLSPASPQAMAARLAALRQGLADHGYREGRNLTIEYRWGEGNDERLPALAAEIARSGVALVLIHGVQSAQLVRKASPDMPIVCFLCGDVIGTGLVQSLARPGGNITGLTSINPATSGKRLELLKEVVPRLGSVALMWNSRNPVSGPEVKESEAAAKALGLQVRSIGVSDPASYKDAFAAMASERVQGLVIISDATFYGQRRQIAALAQAHAIPAVAWVGEFAADGLLMGYGPDGLAQIRRAGFFVDRILKGASAGEIPMEQPTKFQFIINLKTARALKVTIPPAVIARADTLIP
jgi:putative ABC transport system substrate-binding protein